MKLTVIFLVAVSVIGTADSDVYNQAGHSLDSATLASIALQLDKAMYGNAYAKGTPEYEHRRPVHNGACRHIYPAIVVVPHNTEDVSLAVKAAVHHGLPVSFRSGGHSFICQGIRQDALHIDLRNINHVTQLSPYQVAFGSGTDFGKVLKVVSPEKYTMIHGQSLTVGVAGYLQGLGVNPMGTSQRYGFGSDHVLQYTMVLADGSIATVNKDNTTITKPGLSREK
jgi:FAD/FMN-containing dehydrogenase